MPNRIIKESIGTSEKIASLTDFEFRVWISLIVSADDVGRGDARPAIIRGRCFPLRDQVTARNIDAALHGLATKGLVSLYEVGGKPYFWLQSWAKHQRIRECKPKYPGPDEADNVQQSGVPFGHSPQLAATCGEAPHTAAERGLNTIQSNTNPNPNQNSSFCAEPETVSTPPAVISMPLNDGSEWPIYQDKIDKWQTLYPAVDVRQELREMVGWLDSNPTKRKTKTGISRFITGWLGREQDKGGSRSAPPARKSWMDIAEEIEREGGEHDAP